MAMDKAPLLAQPLHCSVFSQQAKLSRINSFGFNGPSPGSNSRGPVVGVDPRKAVAVGLSRFDRFPTRMLFRLASRMARPVFKLARQLPMFAAVTAVRIFSSFSCNVQILSRI